MDLLSELVTLGRKASDPAVRSITVLLEHATAVRIQPVSDYLYTGTDQEWFELDKDFPNLAPPWPYFFMTWRQPPYSLSEGVRIPNPLAAHTDFGALCVAMDLMDPAYAQHKKIDQQPPDAKWFLSFELFLRMRDEGIAYQQFCMNIKENGEYCQRNRDHDNGTDEFIGTPPGIWPEEREGDRAKAMASVDYTKGTLYPVFLAMSFCHCKNVRVEREAVPAKVLKKRAKTREWSPTAWHNIIIDPMRKVLKAEERDPNTGKTSIRRAIVSRRAHFKTFTDERKLFGRWTGTYFWPALQKANTDYLVRAASQRNNNG